MVKKVETPTLKARQAQESQQLISSENLQRDANYRDYLRVAIDDIQKVVREIDVSGSLGSALQYRVYSFSKAVESEIARLATKGATSESDVLSIVPKHKEHLKEQIVKALRVHLIGFFRANAERLSGSVFEDPVLNEDQKRARSHYVQEFISNYLAHLYLLGKEDSKTSRQASILLATRRTPEFTKEFFYGSYVHDLLIKENILLSTEDEAFLFSDAEKRDLLWNNPNKFEERIITTGKNWINLSDPTYISPLAGELAVPIFDVFSKGLRHVLAKKFSENSLPQVVRRVVNNYRLLKDRERLARTLEEIQGLRIISGISIIFESMTKVPGLILVQDLPNKLAQWLRQEVSFGSGIDPLRENIMFEDLRAS